MDGLRPMFIEKLGPHNIQTYTEMVQRAQLVEDTMAKVEGVRGKDISKLTFIKRGAVNTIGTFLNNNHNNNYNNNKRPTIGKDYGTQKRIEVEETTMVEYFKCCDKPGHQADKCWKKAGACLRCRSQEHRIPNYPMLRDQVGRNQGVVKRQRHVNAITPVELPEGVYAPHLVGTERLKANRFMDGLRPMFIEKLGPHKIQSYTEMVQRAQLVEDTMAKVEGMRGKDISKPTFIKRGAVNTIGTFLNNNHNNNNNYNNNKRPTIGKDYGTQKRIEVEETTMVEYFKCCDKPGHQANKCWKKAGACLRCRSQEHRIPNCPMLRDQVGRNQGVVKRQRRVNAITPVELPEGGDYEIQEEGHVEDGNVSEWNLITLSLNLYAPHLVGTERLKANRFMDGLRPMFIEKLGPHKIQSYTEMVQRVQLVEDTMAKVEGMRGKDISKPTFIKRGAVNTIGTFLNNNHNNNKNYNNNKRPTIGKDYGTQKRIEVEETTMVEYCKCCDKLRHQADKCWKKAGACLRCGSQKHCIPNCPMLRDQVGRNQGVVKRQERVNAITPVELPEGGDYEIQEEEQVEHLSELKKKLTKEKFTFKKAKAMLATWSDEDEDEDAQATSGDEVIQCLMARSDDSNEIHKRKTLKVNPLKQALLKNNLHKINFHKSKINLALQQS
ncbi:hypothetical protein Taro_016891 [Colocasia esculenta]|uniref:CCHC-type domain-containing protein n=1 Tax=Colocasia esculenta TaxID=4460 RepID=A0A843UQ09_COLES|nr:hypothetical protein [Colocasia esculenta]